VADPLSPLREQHEAFPDQRSTYEQVQDLLVYARNRKMYDAEDWLVRQWPALTSTEFLGAGYLECQGCGADTHTGRWEAIQHREVIKGTPCLGEKYRG
jgi:hypothetical protein